MKPLFGRSGIWRGSIIREQKRFNTPYMPWPFDKYKRPGSAKYWLSKYPPADQSQDQYEQETIYLDELDERVRQAAKNYSPSARWKKAYNEYGWYSDEHVTEFYGSVGGDASQELLKKYGRGNKIDPSHYINPKYSLVSRAILPSQYMHPDLRKRLGPLQHLLNLPPEEPSVMKLWNPWNLAAGTAAVAFSKEWFLVSHDFWHAMTFWITWAIIISICVDWWTWWQVLRGQESYDRDYFPLNERVEHLFTALNKLEDKPMLAMELAGFGNYVRQINQRCVDKKKADSVASLNTDTLELLEAKLKEENATKTAVANSFRETAFNQALDAVQKDKKGYMSSALSRFAGNAEFKTGEAVRTSGLTTFKDSYNNFLSNAEQKYLTDQRRQGTLPWVFASEQELQAKRMKPDGIKQIYDDKVKAFEQKFNPVQVRTI